MISHEDANLLLPAGGGTSESRLSHLVKDREKGLEGALCRSSSRLLIGNRSDNARACVPLLNKGREKPYISCIGDCSLLKYRQAILRILALVRKSII